MSLPTGTVAYLFTDIEGSTRLAGDLGDAFADLLTRHFEILDRAVADHGGTAVSSEGDALFAVFPSARQAVGAAVQAQQGLASQTWPRAAGVRVRMGIHAGEAILGGRNYTGLEVHRAARIMGAGWGGQILVSESVASLLGEGSLDGVTLTDLGAFHLRDLPSAERLFQATAPGLAADFPPPHAEAATTPNNLPSPQTRFVGRRAEIAKIGGLLQSDRLVTLVGPGGTGKTRLTIEAARSLLRDFPDGVWFVALDVVRDPALVMPTIALTLGVTERPGRTIADLLAQYLAGRRTLLVLDNLEQVIEAAADIGALLAAAPALRVLASSRESLQVAGERTFAVPPLALPMEPGAPKAADIAHQESVILFVERARAARPDFHLTDANAPAVAAICRRLDGLPLAIELAAARSNVLTPEQILERLDHRLTLLAGSRRDLPERQRSLRGAIDWSHDLLDEPQRAFFRRFGVFTGGAELEAVEAVIDPDHQLEVDVLDLAGGLVDRSLLLSRQESGGSRLEMLETIREYAVERLAASPEERLVRDRHLGYFQELARQARNVLGEADPEPILIRTEAELPNIRAAITWSKSSGQVDHALCILTDLADFWHMCSHATEARYALEYFLDATEHEGSTAVRARGIIALGRLCGWQSDYGPAFRYTSAGLEMADALGELVDAGEARVGLGWALIESQPEQSLVHFQTAADALRNSDHGASLAGALQGLPLALLRLGRRDEADAQARKAIEVVNALGNPYLAAFNFLTLAALALQVDDYDVALENAGDALRRSQVTGGQIPIALAVDVVASVLLARGETPSAARLGSATAAIRTRMGGGVEITVAGLEPLLPRVLAAMDPEAFRQARDEGAVMPIEEAIRQAFSVIG